MHPLSGNLFISCTLVFIYFIGNVRAEVFTSMADVQRLIDSERNVVQILKFLVKAEKEKIAAIEEYIDFFTSQYDKPDVDAATVVSHPVNAFRLVKHLSADWDNLKRRYLQFDLGSAAVIDCQAQRANLKFPEEEDIKGAAEAIARLQRTYQIETEDFAAGNIPGTAQAPALKAAECYLIGHRQALEGIHDYAIQWLEIALRKFDEENVEFPKIRKVDILDWLQYSYYHSGNPLRALEVSEIVKQVDPAFPTVDENIKFYKKLLAPMPEVALKAMEDQQRPTPIIYRGGKHEALCRGEGQVAKELEPFLKCYYENYGNPELLLQPVKYEVAHRDPDVYILHDVALPQQMERIKEVAQSFLQRATVVKSNSTETEFAKIRISKTAFLAESVDPVIAAVNRRIGQITNLDMEQAEALQVANYGIGGHYNAHYDFFRNPNDPNTKQIDPTMGDRIATFLMYMTDVEAGGATSFPNLNLALFPKKGSAAFWWNLHRDGNGDIRTLHEGCPVLSGNKWVSNKWVREIGQKSRPCGLKTDTSVIPGAGVLNKAQA